MTALVVVPFALVGGAQPLLTVPVAVDGRGPYIFVVDTGAGPTLLAPGLARELGVEAAATKEGHGLAHRATVRLARVRSLRLGSEERAGFEVVVAEDVDRIAAAVGGRLDGVLGHSFLGRYAVTVDYPAGTLRLDESAATEPDDLVLPFRLAAPTKPLLVVDAELDGRGPFALAVDTGASTTLLDAATAQRLGIATVPIPAVTGAGGTAETRAGTLRSLKLGAVEQRDLAVVVAPLAALNAALGTRLDGIVGYNFLRRYRVTIDYRGERLLLRRG